SPDIKASRHDLQSWILSPCHNSCVVLRHGCLPASEADSAATAITAPTALPDTAEIANSWLPTEGDCCRSSTWPMTLAVKKPARLAPPAAATMMGRGHCKAAASVPSHRLALRQSVNALF